MPNIPQWLEPFMLTISYGLTVLLAVAIWWAAGRAGLDGARRVGAWLVAVAILVAWQAAGQALARAGAFLNGPDHLGPGVGMGVVIPVAVGLAAIAASRTARSIVQATPLSALVAIQVYRVLGAVFLVLWAAGQLPGAFALPAGVGDIAIGLAAPIVGLALLRRPGATNLAAWWNTLGILDLVVAVSTGFLSSPGTWQMLSLDAPNQLVTAYPLALVPLYAVPISFILHGLVWQRLRGMQPRETVIERHV